jgi:hypothetical protein
VDLGRLARPWNQTYKHLSATEKLIAICQAFGDITGPIDCEICREIVDASRNQLPGV